MLCNHYYVLHHNYIVCFCIDICLLDEECCFSVLLLIPLLIASSMATCCYTYIKYDMIKTTA